MAAWPLANREQCRRTTEVTAWPLANRARSVQEEDDCLAPGSPSACSRRNIMPVWPLANRARAVQEEEDRWPTDRRGS